LFCLYPQCLLLDIRLYSFNNQTYISTFQFVYRDLHGASSFTTSKYLTSDRGTVSFCHTKWMSGLNTTKSVDYLPKTGSINHIVHVRVCHWICRLLLLKTCQLLYYLRQGSEDSLDILWKNLL
jgi:hypothetical protein